MDAHAGEPTTPNVFISYNKGDRQIASDIALALRSQNLDVFIDHWEMQPGDRLLSRIKDQLSASDFLVVLLSPRSVASDWVRIELEFGLLKEQSEGRRFVLPVLVEDCELPDSLAHSVHIDYRPSANGSEALEVLINTIKRRQPFSLRVRDYLAAPPHSVYEAHVRAEGLQGLQKLAAMPELLVTETRRGLLWELFRKFLRNYHCTLKVASDKRSGTTTFMLYDRWQNSAHHIVLTAADFNQGLWEVDLKLLDAKHPSQLRLRSLGETGRLSWRSACNPKTNVSPATPQVHPFVSRCLQHLETWLHATSPAAVQSMLYDLQRVIEVPGFHDIRCVVGRANEDMTLAFSSMRGGASDRPGPSAVFELFDPFFSSLKMTHLYESQLDEVWEGDVNLMDGDSETYLGLA